MNIIVNARHMESTTAIRDHIEAKATKLERIYNNLMSVEVTLDREAEHSVVEVVATAKRRNTFVATHKEQDMYACIDHCLHKIEEQIRRHKDKVRDRQGPPHEQTMSPGEEE